MRIVIETDANAPTAVTPQTPAVPSAVAAVNGGAAPKRAQSTASSPGSALAAHNAGPPPKWLHDAIAAAAPSPSALEKQASDGGAGR